MSPGWKTWICRWLCRVFCAAFVLSASANDLGPLYDKIRLTLEPGYGYEAAGPLWGNYQLDEERSLWRFSPLMSMSTDEGADFTEFDLAYPLLTYDRFGAEYRFQIGQLFAFSGGRRGDEDKDKRFTLFPLYFQQRSTNPTNNFTAVMPFYGRLQNRLFRDEVKWVMLPLYLQSRKRDVVTDNYLYPFFHLREGDGLKGWQFFPVFGQERKEVTYQTDMWDEKQMVPGHYKMFAGWPFFSFERRALGTENPVMATHLLPLYALQRSALKNSTTVMWPFLRYSTDTTTNYREVNAPWPFIVWARGENRHIDRVWPIWSDTRAGFTRSKVFLFPLYKEKTIDSPEVKSRRTRIALSLYQDIHDESLETGQDRRQIHLWPLFAYERDFEDKARLQLIAPLEPLLRNNKGVKRNYSPMWSIYRKEENPNTGFKSHSILWNLLRFDRNKVARKDSILFGLFRYESTPEGSEARLFHFIRLKGKGGGEVSEEPAEEEKP